jgi:hypothetical protein
MRIKNSKVAIAVGFVALLVGVFVITTRSGQAQPLDLQPVVRLADATDSWRVQVKNACLVDSVRVRAGSVPSEQDQDFQTDKFTDDPKTAGDTAQGKAACANAKESARKELPAKLWAAGDKLCSEWEKAPPNKARKACFAVRGSLEADSITCSCGFEPQDPKFDDTRKWRAKARCVAPDVKYVCDP